MMRRRLTALLLCAACAGDGDLAELTGESVIGPSGTAMWNKAAQTPGFDHDFSFKGVAATPEGEAIAIGLGNGDVIFTDGSRVSLAGVPNAPATLVTRFDIYGRRVWTVVSGGGSHDSLEDVVVGADGAIALWGRGSPDLGCGNPPGDWRTFHVTGLAATGACSFTRVLAVTESTGFGAGGGVAIDPTTGDVLAVTAVVGELLLDGESIWDGPVDSHDADLVLLRFAADGELLDVASSAHGQLQIQDLGADDAGRVVVSGTTYTAGADLGDGTRVVPARQAAWVVGYSADFTRAWSHVWGEDANVLDMTVHPDGHIALGGSFRGDLDFGNTSTHTPFPSADLYVVKLDAGGADLWNRHIWGTPGSAA